MLICRYSARLSAVLETRSCSSNDEFALACTTCWAVKWCPTNLAFLDDLSLKDQAMPTAGTPTSDRYQYHACNEHLQYIGRAKQPEQNECCERIEQVLPRNTIIYHTNNVERYIHSGLLAWLDIDVIVNPSAESLFASSCHAPTNTQRDTTRLIRF